MKNYIVKARWWKCHLLRLKFSNSKQPSQSLVAVLVLASPVTQCSMRVIAVVPSLMNRLLTVKGLFAQSVIGITTAVTNDEAPDESWGLFFALMFDV
jgi:hypothetical protein